MNILIFGVLIFCVLIFGVLIGFCLKSSKKSNLIKHTKNIPSRLFRVVSSDRVSTVLEGINMDKKRFLVSTDVFGGKPIQPKDVVRKIKSVSEQNSLGIPPLGYIPLVKETEEEINKKYCVYEHMEEKVRRGKEGHFHNGNIKE